MSGPYPRPTNPNGASFPPEGSRAIGPLQSIFIGKSGIRAGWGVLVFLTIFVTSAKAIGHLIGLIPGLKAPEGSALSPTPMIVGGVVAIAATCLATFIMSRIEGRPILSYWLAASNRWSKFGKGLLAGIVAMSALTGILYAAHLLVFDGRALSGAAIVEYGLAWAICFLLVGIFEENVSRGYIHFTITRGLNFFWASVLTSSLFLYAHVSNSGENVVGLALVFAAGAFFCLALRLTGSLYWPIGFHAAWDWCQSYLFGVADSGQVSQGRLLVTHPHGDPIWSGGSAGPEGSIFALLILIVASGLLWLSCRKNAPPHMGTAVPAKLPPSPPAQDLAYANPA